MKSFILRGKQGFDLILGLFSFLGVIVIFFVLILVCISVFMRYCVNEPIGWAVQLSEYSLVFITFFGAAWLLKKEKHVKMDIISRIVGFRGQKIFGIFNSTIGVIVCSVITYRSALITMDYFQRKLYDYQVLETPLWPIYAIITFGFFALIIQFLRRAYGYLEQLKEYRKNQISK